MEGLCRGWEKVELDQTGACLASRRPLPRLGSLLGTRRGGDLSCTRPNFAGGRSRPQTGACLALHKMQDPKQAPVYSRADCVASNRRLFGIEDGIMVAQKALSGEQRGIAAGQRPDKDFGWLFTFASDKGFLE